MIITPSNSVSSGNFALQQVPKAQRIQLFHMMQLLESQYMRIQSFQELKRENAFSTLRDRYKNPKYERQTPASIISSIASSEMYGLKKKITAIDALCQTFSCANAPSCPQKQSTWTRNHTRMMIHVKSERNSPIDQPYISNLHNASTLPPRELGKQQYNAMHVMKNR